MTLYENEKRVCARGITFIDDDILLIERHKKENERVLHYFTIPGGGVDVGETYEDAAVRETLEETTVKTKVVKFLKKEEFETGIVYWYLLEYISGTPKLGGEELERNNADNHYKVVLKNIKEINDLPILGEGKQIIKNVLNEVMENDKKEK